jgi:hypothetical protein
MGRRGTGAEGKTKKPQQTLYVVDLGEPWVGKRTHREGE